MSVKYTSIQHLHGSERKVAAQRLRRAALTAQGLTIRGEIPQRKKHPALVGLSWRERNTRYLRLLRAERRAAGLTWAGFLPKQRRPVKFRGQLNTTNPRARRTAMVQFYRYAESLLPCTPHS
jgi:hypothetical protein